MSETFKIFVYEDSKEVYSQRYTDLGQAVEDYAKYKDRGTAQVERLVALLNPNGDVIVKKSLRNLQA